MNLAAQVAALKRDCRLLAGPEDRPLEFAAYRERPVGFATHVLKQRWTPAQQNIARLLMTPPHRVLVAASHNCGKTHLSAGVVLWWHLTRSPAIIITTAPKLEQVRDLLWKEIRRQGRGLVSFPGPRMCRLERDEEDFAVGTTARTGTAFQGHHGPHNLLVFDEATGVANEFWEVAETMFQLETHGWLCIFNPTDTSTAAYQQWNARNAAGDYLWHRVTMSATDHPNIAAERAGRAPPVPSAIRLKRLDDMLHEWCDPVHPGTQVVTDIEWPIGSGHYLRPGPLAEARLLGRWASSGRGVWSDALWQACCVRNDRPLNPAWQLVIGCDVARYGEDYTAIVVRLGPVALHFEQHNGWNGAQIVGRLKQLCREWANVASNLRDPNAERLKAERVPVYIDDDGLGGMGVVDHHGGFAFRGVSAAKLARDQDTYHRMRDELWHNTANRAKRGDLDLSRLPKDVLQRLQGQALAPTYGLTPDGRLQVESKDKTKERIGHSPDGMDALNLAFLELPSMTFHSVEPSPRPDSSAWRDTSTGGHFGGR